MGTEWVFETLEFFINWHGYQPVKILYNLVAVKALRYKPKKQPNNQPTDQGTKNQ
jgi:hypothetical protein